MHPALRPARHRALVPGLTALAVGLVPLALVASPSAAAPAGDRVVVSEVYAGGGSAASTLARDYVELFNPTSAPVSLDGTSVQYRSAAGAGNPSGVTPLTGSVPAGGYYLVALSGSGSGTGAGALPPPTPAAARRSARRAAPSSWRARRPRSTRRPPAR